MTIDEIRKRAHESVEIMVLRKQVRAGREIITTMARRLAEMEIKNVGKTQNKRFKRQSGRG